MERVGSCASIFGGIIPDDGERLVSSLILLSLSRRALSLFISANGILFHPPSYLVFYTVLFYLFPASLYISFFVVSLFFYTLTHSFSLSFTHTHLCSFIRSISCVISYFPILSSIYSSYVHDLF